MKLSQGVIAALVAGVVFIAGLAAGRYSTPTKVVIKTETVTVEKEVIKIKEKDTTETNKNRELIVTETVLPDGTRKIEKRYTNRDEIRSTSDRTNTTTTTSSSSSRTLTELSSQKNDWILSALVTKSHTADDVFHQSLSYGVHIQRRILGPFNIGAFGITNRTYGLSIGASF